MPRIRADGGLIGRVNDPTITTATGMWSLKAAEKANRGAEWPVGTYAGSIDSYFNLTTLLLHGDGTNGANNTVFADQSTNAYTVTFGGKPMQGTFSPFGFTGWSNYFNGSTDYISATADPFGMGTGNFTVEFWVYKNDAWGTSSQMIFDAGASTSMGVWVNTASGTLRLSRSGVDFPIEYAYSSLSPYTWYHIVFVRSGTTLSMYINGTRVNSVTSSASFAAGTTFNIGRNTGGTQYWNGYISNFRAVKGAAVYDPTLTTLTVPTTALTAVASTSLLTCQDNRFKDNSTNATTLATAGTPSVQAFSPFAPAGPYTSALVGGSTYFNGTTDHLTLPNNMTVVGTNAYTLEGWFYPTSVSAAEIPLVKLYNATQTIELRIVSSKIQGRINGSATIVGGNTTLYPNQWYHFALVKPTSGTSTAVLYLNGVAEATTASDTTTYTAFTTPRIGANQTPNIYYTGWAAGVRFLNGTAQYTGNFTPPTSPFTNITNTLFLVNSTNAGIIDNTMRNNFNTNGTAALSTTQSKFGGTSMYFDGSTGAIAAPYVSSLHSFHLSDFTVEMWIYPLSYTNMASGVGQQPTTIGGMVYNGTTADWSLGMTTAGLLKFYYWNGGAVSITSSTTVPLNTWSHIAATKTSSGITLFYNGAIASGPTAISGTPSIQAGTFLTMGAYNSVFMNAYVDDVRISKYARYTTTFDPTYFAAFLNQ